MMNKPIHKVKVEWFEYWETTCGLRIKVTPNAGNVAFFKEHITCKNCLRILRKRGDAK